MSAALLPRTVRKRKGKSVIYGGDGKILRRV